MVWPPSDNHHKQESVFSKGTNVTFFISRMRVLTKPNQMRLPFSQSRSQRLVDSRSFNEKVSVNIFRDMKIFLLAYCFC